MPGRSHAALSCVLLGLAVLGGCSWDWESRNASPDDGGFDAESDAPPDAPVDTDPCDTHADALFCDGFESGDLSAWGGAVGAPVEIVETAHSGKYAARGATSGQPAQSRIAAEWDTPVTEGSIYVRGYFFVPASVEPAGANLFDLSGETGRIAVVLGTNDGTVGTTFLSNNIPNGGGGVSSAPEAVERGVWQCLELAVEIGGVGEGTITLSRGGVPFENGNRVGVNTDPGAGFTSVRLPVQYTPENAPFEALVDDVVVDTAPIGCDP